MQQPAPHCSNLSTAPQTHAAAPPVPPCSVPDALCFRAKTDRRLRTWKRRASEEGDFDVEAVVSLLSFN